MGRFCLIYRCFEALELSQSSTIGDSVYDWCEEGGSSALRAGRCGSVCERAAATVCERGAATAHRLRGLSAAQRRLAAAERGGAAVSQQHINARQVSEANIEPLAACREVNDVRKIRASGLRY